MLNEVARSLRKRLSKSGFKVIVRVSSFDVSENTKMMRGNYKEEEGVSCWKHLKMKSCLSCTVDMSYDDNGKLACIIINLFIICHQENHQSFARTILAKVWLSPSFSFHLLSQLPPCLIILTILPMHLIKIISKLWTF